MPLALQPEARRHAEHALERQRHCRRDGGLAVEDRLDRRGWVAHARGEICGRDAPSFQRLRQRFAPGETSLGEYPFCRFFHHLLGPWGDILFRKSLTDFAIFTPYLI